MARKPRLEVPGGLYHVILRGNAQQDIFFTDDDRQAFYDLLGEGSQRFGYRIHAFCLMTNHIHLAIQTSEKPLSQSLHNLSFRYTRYVNKTQNRAGHLFQGRYKALLVDADSYLLETGALYSLECGEGSHRAPTLGPLVDWYAREPAYNAEELATPSRNRALSRTRGLIAWLAKQSGAGSLSALARRFRRDVSSSRRGVERIEKAAQGPSAQARRLQKYRDA